MSIKSRSGENAGAGEDPARAEEWIEPVPHKALRAHATRQADITLHQLRIFWAVVHSETLTRAAKQLGLTQPSLSQQLSKLENTVGTRLFHRRSSELTLTEAGEDLLPKVEHVLRGMRALEDDLYKFSIGQRVTIRIAGIDSVLRVILPEAITRTRADFAEAEFDIQASAPADVLELLYARRINIGLVAANSIAEANVGFLQVPISEDPYVLAVPDRLDLAQVRDPARDLGAKDLDLLNHTIKFIFGTQHAKRVEQWYDQMLPEHQVVAQCRSFEVAIGLVKAGTGICMAPALSALNGSGSLSGLKLYRVNSAPRRVVALVPSQYRRREPFATLIDAMQEAGSHLQLPPILPTPPFLDRPPASREA